MAPGIILSIQSALDHLQSCINKYGFENDESRYIKEAVICRLRCLRTFILCSKKLGNDVQLISLWGRLDDVVRKILDDELSLRFVTHDAKRFFRNIEPFVEEMDKWFIILTGNDLQQYTNLPVVVMDHVLDEILGSVVENFEDFLICIDEYSEDRWHLLRQRQIQALKEHMTFFRNLVGFATLLCGDQHQEVQNLYTKIEALAISAAHLTVYMFTSEDTIDRMNSINSALQLMIKHFHNPQLYETYCRALASFKYSRELYPPTRHDPIIVMMDFIGYLLILLWDMLQSVVSSINPLPAQLYDGLRFLRTLLRKLPKMFHTKTRDTTRVAICNAGVIIFSIYQKDFVVDRELQDFFGNIMVIQSEFEEKKLSFPGTTVLAFLTSLLDYMKKVSSSKVHSSVLSCVPIIREDLAFLISFMGILMELKESLEDLHEGLWNLLVKVAYKLEFLVDQLVLGNILRSFSMSFLSIAADMRIIKTDALKIFEDKRLDKVRDIKMAARIIISIQPVQDHLESCMKRNGFKTIKSKEMKAAVSVICRLRCVRTFVICSTKLGINVELRSLWVRLDDVIGRILDDKFSRHSTCDDTVRFIDNLESFMEEMDKWFIVFSDYCLQQSTLAATVTSQVLDDLIGSVVENFEDLFTVFRFDTIQIYQIKSLKNYMVFLRTFIRFATLACADQHQEVQDLFSQIEGIAVNAAHLTLCIFAVKDTSDRMKSINSSLLLRINRYHNPQLYESYSRALACLKYSPTLQDPMLAMMDFIRYLLILRDMREFGDVAFVNPSHMSQLTTLYDGLKSLTVFFEKLPSMFHGKIRDITRVAICDAGVIIFSLHQRDFLIDCGLQDFLKHFKVIQSEFEEKKYLTFTNSTILGFLDSIMDKHSKVHLYARKSEPIIQLDLVFLRSLMVKLVELRNQQEDLHQALWILAVKVAYKFELLVDKLDGVGMTGVQTVLSMSFLSIAADMNVIKTDSFKIFHDKTIEEDRDIEMASQRIMSIHSALDHLQSFLDRDSKYSIIVMNRLRCLRTFFLCSTKLGSNAQLRTLLAKLDGIVCEILDCIFLESSHWFVDRMEPFDEEIDEWFIRLSYYNLQQCSSSPMATRVKDILDSLFDNLEDFQSFRKSKKLEFDDRIDALKDTIAFLPNFITFASLMCADQHQEVRDIFTQIEAFAISASHLTVLLYTRDEEISAYRMESMISVLQLRIRHFQNFQFYAPTLHTKEDPLIVMTDSIDSLLSLLWNMLLSDVALSVPSQSQLGKLDSGLRSLKALLREQPNNFDDKIMDMTRLAICNIGYIFSLDPKDFDIDHSLQEFQTILKKVEAQVVPTSTFNFPNTIVLGFLDFLVEYMTEVESSRFDSDTLNSVAEIWEVLACLRLLMVKLVDLRDQREDLHQDLWNLGAATAYKIEFLIDQLVLGDIADSFSMSVQSITEDMVILRNDSMEVFNMGRQEINVQKINWASIDQLPLQSSKIELSYNNLPDPLKRCFLSFAAFPEDHEISVKRLIWMWIAEGFVRKSESKSLEEVATDYLESLIGRSLVVNVKERSIGGVKACRIHDLARTFCLKKASEEFFLHRLEGSGELSSFHDPGNMRRLCILSKSAHLKKSKMFWPCVRSLLFFGNACIGYDMSFLFRIFKLLRVLDMERVYLSFKSPSEIRFLVQLRYLAIQVYSEVDPSIGRLSKLETLVLRVVARRVVRFPDTFWNLQKLRHLYSSDAYIEFPVVSLESTGSLVNMDSLSILYGETWHIMEKQLRKFPNIRQLKCHLFGNWNRSQAISFSFLMHLESLSLLFGSNPNRDEYELTFPKTLKKLTLNGCEWPWRKISGIAGLPNLEVLKLLYGSFVGELWHVEEEDFPQLKVLELSGLNDIVKWTASDDQFRNLETLILDGCRDLEEIPECLETVDTLKLIEVNCCSDCIARSVKKVEEYQKEMGNSVLCVDVYPVR